jgi:hypothetical protein
MKRQRVLINFPALQKTYLNLLKELNKKNVVGNLQMGLKSNFLPSAEHELKIIWDTWGGKNNEMPKSGKILFNSYPKVAHPKRL